MTKYLRLVALLCVAALLAACGVTAEMKKERQTPDEVNLTIVQKAVDAYREKTSGLLPIKTMESSVDKYIKYPIDFQRLKKEGLLDVLPSNSFEKGGVYQYVIWNAESKKPLVKLIDLQQAEIIQELAIKKKVNGYVPMGDKIHGNVYRMDFEKMGYKEDPVVQSPYSNVFLPFVIKGTGEILVDYSIELQKIINETKPKVAVGKDIRYLLEEKYPILPAFSSSYVLNSEGEVEFFNDLKNK